MINGINEDNLSEALVDKADIDLGNVSEINGEMNSELDKKVNESDLLNIVYPIGSIYLSVNEVNPSTFIGGTWVKVSDGRVLQGVGSGQTAGSTIEAGLPNITGTLGVSRTLHWYNGTPMVSGPFSATSASGTVIAGSTGTSQIYQYDFNAANSNSIYGNSNTVQPPAFLVYIWKRTT